ncbi:MAG: hypothetical protein KY394_01150, partial [Actinobacteria bacterium]|nr:hypothetical protein [Actinomycetota bacterium]
SVQMIEQVSIGRQLLLFLSAVSPEHDRKITYRRTGDRPQTRISPGKKLPQDIIVTFRTTHVFIT